ncbi:hypothetical protein L484_008146 [Morus notabilis]|uniref:Uncharacterized protein n=1 Tax=Morus notabilis TaxID=981085 RepID=W9SL07_9ROSA|nr:hypothetical protein L484_008146 [Morus notabilis]
MCQRLTRRSRVGPSCLLAYARLARTSLPPAQVSSMRVSLGFPFISAWVPRSSSSPTASRHASHGAQMLPYTRALSAQLLSPGRFPSTRVSSLYSAWTPLCRTFFSANHSLPRIHGEQRFLPLCESASC